MGHRTRFPKKYQTKINLAEMEFFQKCTSNQTIKLRTEW